MNYFQAVPLTASTKVAAVKRIPVIIFTILTRNFEKRFSTRCCLLFKIPQYEIIY